jgi:DNA processing protein
LRKHPVGENASADRQLPTVFDGAYGIDAAAHHGALAAGGVTIAVLACGPDVPYPRAHRRLLADIAARGSVVSECPPGRPPSRLRLLARNRIIAALARGTVVIEAAERSGTLVTARHASDLARPLMAVPGPITSMTSAGCNALIRDQRAACVTSADDIIADTLRMAGTRTGTDRSRALCRQARILTVLRGQRPSFDHQDAGRPNLRILHSRA